MTIAAIIPEKRWAPSLALSWLTTFLLLITMNLLVSVEYPNIADPKPPVQIDISSDGNRGITERREEPPEKPEPAEKEPAPPTLTQQFIDPNPMVVAMGPPSPTVDPIGNPTLTSATAIPILRVAPIFPNGALRRGITGFVDLIFDISQTGVPQNIRVLHAEPGGYFETASIKSLAKWKYNPATDDQGHPVVYRDVTTRIRFDLE